MRLKYNGHLTFKVVESTKVVPPKSQSVPPKSTSVLSWLEAGGGRMDLELKLSVGQRQQEDKTTQRILDAF